jgi:hypothetical protein
MPNAHATSAAAVSARRPCCTFTFPTSAARVFGLLRTACDDSLSPIILATNATDGCSRAAASEKRVENAIKIARRAGIPGVEFIGEIGDHDKGEFLGRAMALLFPIDWPEPSGWS